MSKEIVPFAQRFGLVKNELIFDDFPESGRVALARFFEDLVGRNFVGLQFKENSDGWASIKDEFNRTFRTFNDFSRSDASCSDDFLEWLKEVDWIPIYTFCERVYKTLLKDAYHWVDFREEFVITTQVTDVRIYYTDELNTILAEENIGYFFADGQFQRRGRAQTQKNIQRVGSVLGGKRFFDVRSHYNKSRKFFEQFPYPDVQNCVKEALSALEACLSIVTGMPVSNNFSKVVKQFMGKEDSDIPYPIGEGMIKLHAYRGSGKGIAHAATKGNKVTEIDAELVLSLTAAYITYLIDLFPIEQEDEIPF